MSSIVSVNIQTQGMWPTHHELDVRDSILEELEHRQFGKFQGTGAGFGSMDIAFEVSNEVAAMTELQRIVESRLKSGDYTLHSVPIDHSKVAATANTNEVKSRELPQIQQQCFDLER